MRGLITWDVICVERGHVLGRRFVPVWVRAVRGFHAGFAPNAFICTVRPDACRIQGQARVIGIFNTRSLMSGVVLEKLI